MKNQFDNAIRKTGGFARLSEGSDTAFPVSIQPGRVDGDGHSEIGIGAFHYYTIYTVCNEITDSLREGSSLTYQNRRYIVKNIETIYLGEESVFRQGTLIAEQEG